MRKILFIVFITFLLCACKKKQLSEVDNSIFSQTKKYEGEYNGYFLFDVEVQNDRYTYNKPPFNLEIISHPSESNTLIIVTDYFWYKDTFHAEINFTTNKFVIPIKVRDRCKFGGYGEFDSTLTKFTFYNCDNSNKIGWFEKVSDSGFTFYLNNTPLDLPFQGSSSKKIEIVKFGNFNDFVSISSTTTNNAIVVNIENNNNKPNFSSLANISTTNSMDAYDAQDVVTIHAQSGNKKLSKKLPLNVYKPNCIDDFEGNYTARQTKPNYHNYPVNVVKGENDTLKFNGLLNGFLNIYAIKDCAKRELIIPEQTFNDYKIKGIGGFNEYLFDNVFAPSKDHYIEFTSEFRGNTPALNKIEFYK